MTKRLVVLFILVGLVISGTCSACRLRERAGPVTPPPLRTPRPVAPPAPEPPVTTAPAAATTGEPATHLPSLTSEPRLRILLARGDGPLVALLRPGRTAAGERIPAGTYTARLTPAGPQLGTVALGDEPLRFAKGAGATFRIGQRSFAGDLTLRPFKNTVAVCEVQKMETYLRGVLAKEVEPDWPLESLKALAVAARSYAAARWMARHRFAWHLDASEQVDMAYAGWVADPHPRLATALAQTRGDCLWYADQPLPAFFHAASGGHTEAVSAVWPERRTPDGATPLDPAMPDRVDPWDEAGRAVAPRRLGAWKVELPLAQIAEKLRAASKDVGRLTDIRITSMDRDRSRCRRLRVRGSSGQIDLSGHQFRMAMGSTLVKSTRWRDFRIVGDRLIIQGHGYGHGVGLPQASAWAMARAGKQAPEILAFYYAGADLRRRY